MQKHSTVMHRILDMNFCAVQLLITITNLAVLTLRLMRFLSAMVQKVIPETLLIYFLRTIVIAVYRPGLPGLC